MRARRSDLERRSTPSGRKRTGKRLRPGAGGSSGAGSTAIMRRCLMKPHRLRVVVLKRADLTKAERGIFDGLGRRYVAL